MDYSFVVMSFIAVSAAYLWGFARSRARLLLIRSSKKHGQLQVRHDRDSHHSHPDLLGPVEGFRGRHEAADVLLSLIEQDGAGEWPPRVVYDSWPAAIQPYKDIYLELAPMLSCANPLVGDDVLMARRQRFRNVMQERLRERINIIEVEDLLNGAEAGNWFRIRRDQLNGVYCAVAVLRHAYRYVVLTETKKPPVRSVLQRLKNGAALTLSGGP